MTFLKPFLDIVNIKEAYLLLYMNINDYIILATHKSATRHCL